MNNFFIVLIFISLFSCKAQEKKKSSPSTYNVHSEIEPYVKTFKAKMLLGGVNKSMANLQASFSKEGELQVGEAGRCTIRTTSSEMITYSTPILKISPVLWDLMTEADREEIIYHELGHCILGKLHITTMNNQIPSSIMYPSHLGEIIYTDNYGNYMVELFSNSSQEMLDLEFDINNYR